MFSHSLCQSSSEFARLMCVKPTDLLLQHRAEEQEADAVGLTDSSRLPAGNGKVTCDQYSTANDCYTMKKTQTNMMLQTRIFLGGKQA